MGAIGMARVHGRSMLPTLRPGDRLLVRYDAQARPGSLVLVRFPGRPLAVKRLLRHEPAGGWWVERDNPAEGVDSWSLGAVAEHDLVAVVLGRIWPGPRRFSSSGRGSGPAPA